MANLTITAIYDRLTTSYSCVDVTPHIGHTTRKISQILEEGKGALAQSPADYELWQLGIFDDQTGKITPDPILIINVQNLSRPKGA